MRLPGSAHPGLAPPGGLPEGLGPGGGPAVRRVVALAPAPPPPPRLMSSRSLPPAAQRPPNRIGTLIANDGRPRGGDWGGEKARRARTAGESRMHVPNECMSPTVRGRQRACPQRMHVPNGAGPAACMSPTVRGRQRRHSVALCELDTLHTRPSAAASGDAQSAAMRRQPSACRQLRRRWLGKRTWHRRAHTRQFMGSTAQTITEAPPGRQPC